MDQGDQDNPHRKITPAASQVPSNDSGKILGREQRTKLASYHAKLILGSYRADQANDPDVYVTAIAHLLATYPPEIGAALTDPKNGIAGKYKWLPTVSEVKEEADRLADPTPSLDKFHEAIAKTLQDREKYEREEKAETPEHRHKVAERITREIAAAFASSDGEIYNVFVPTFAPQYRNMVNRGGRPGVSLEDKTRQGVWVPLDWLASVRQSKKATWRRFSAEELLKIYPPKSPG
jgi:hypothetical protein